MIFPIRNEEGATRQLPVVTWTLIALLAVGFAAIDPNPPETDAEAVTPTSSLADAAAYWRDHGYLDAAPEVIARVALDVPAEQREKYIEKLRSRAVDWRPEDDAQVATQQTELNRLTSIGIGQVVPEEAKTHPLHGWGYTAAEDGDSPPMAFLTHLFVHTGWMHWLGNVLLLAFFAPALENRWGRGRFALGASAIVVASLVGHSWFAPAGEQALPLVGASGLVAGLLAAFLVRLWSEQIHYYYFFGAQRSGTFESPAWLVLPFALVAAGLQALFAHPVAASVTWSELGAIAVGLPYALLLRQMKWEDDFAGGVGATSVEAGEVVEAQHDAAELLALITDYAERGETRDASRHWIELARRFPDVRLAAPRLLKLLPALDGPPHTLALEHVLDPSTEGLTAGMALRIHEEQRERRPAVALRAAERALALGELQEGKRERLERAIDELQQRVELDGAQEATGESGIDELDGPAPAEAPEGLAARDESESEATAASDEALAQSSAPEPPARSFEPTPGELRPPHTNSVERPESEGADPAISDAGPKPPSFVEDDELRAVAASLPTYPDLKQIDAKLTRIVEDAVHLETSEGQAVGLPYAKIEAVACGIVRGIAAKPVLLIDLCLASNALAEEPLRVVRLRSDGFDPRLHTPGVTNPAASFRQILEWIVDGSGGTALPDPGSAVGRPFQEFDDLDAYEREVLRVDR